MKQVSEMTRLTPLAFLMLAIWQFTGVLATLDAQFLNAYIVGAPLLIFFYLLDFLTLPKSKQLRITCVTKPRIELDSVTTLGWNIEVIGAQRWPLRGFVLTKPTTSFLKFERTLVKVSKRYKVPGRPEFRIPTKIKAIKLGHVRTVAPNLAASSWWGFWKRHLTPEVAADVRIIPHTEPVPQQEFEQAIRRQRLLFTGARQLVRGINNDQFHSIRKYQFPDSIRHIDQKKSARYQTLMTRTYDSYHNHHLVIACDLGRSMLGNIGVSSKKDFYLSAALNLAENAIHSKDMVSFFSFNQSVTMTIPRSHRIEQFAGLDMDHPALQTKAAESNYEILPQTINQIAKQRAIVVVLCDLTRPSVQQALLETMSYTCRKHLTVFMSVVDRAVSIDHQIANLSQSKISDQLYSDLLYGYWLDDRFLLFEQQIGRLGGGVITCQEKNWLDMTMRMYQLLRSSLRA